MTCPYRVSREYWLMAYKRSSKSEDFKIPPALYKSKNIGSTQWRRGTGKFDDDCWQSSALDTHLSSWHSWHKVYNCRAVPWGPGHMRRGCFQQRYAGKSLTAACWIAGEAVKWRVSMQRTSAHGTPAHAAAHQRRHQEWLNKCV